MNTVQRVLSAPAAVLASRRAVVNSAAYGGQVKPTTTSRFRLPPLSLCSAEASEDGHRDESSAGYCHASAATGKHRLSNGLKCKRVIWVFALFMVCLCRHTG